jgi:hypothetical protein
MVRRLLILFGVAATLSATAPMAAQSDLVPVGPVVSSGLLPALPPLRPDQRIPLDAALWADPRGVSVFEHAVARWAARTEIVDQAWAGYRAACAGISPSAADPLSREWTGLWEGGEAPSESRSSCAPLLNVAMTLGAQVQEGIQSAEDAARRSGLPPATTRQIRAMYGMDWPGWDR